MHAPCLRDCVSNGLLALLHVRGGTDVHTISSHLQLTTSRHSPIITPNKQIVTDRWTGSDTP